MTTHNTPDRPAFVRQQYAFAAHIRNPEKKPNPEGIEERRMKIYRELFYNNVEGFIANTYPVLRRILSDDRWHGMIRDYFAHHLAHTPLFPEMPREFLKYLEHERIPQPDDPPFLLELAHYEWVELALSLLDEKIDETDITKNYTFLLDMSSDSTIFAGNSRHPSHSHTCYETRTSLPAFLSSHILHRLYS